MYVSVLLPQNSLGGNAKTALVVTITGNPDHAQETLSTLQFGTRAKQVIVRAQVNEVVDYKALYDALLAKREQGEDNTTALTLATQQSERRAAQLQEEVDELKKVSHHPLPRHKALQSACAITVCSCREHGLVVHHNGSGCNTRFPSPRLHLVC